MSKTISGTSIVTELERIPLIYHLQHQIIRFVGHV